MPERSVLLIAAVLGTLTALTGCVVAVVLGLVVAAAVPDDGTTLPGLVDGLVAGAIVLVLTVPVTIVVVRWWTTRRATVALLAAPAAGYRVLLAWAARAPSPG